MAVFCAILLCVPQSMQSIQYYIIKVIQVYEIIILARVLFSWFGASGALGVLRQFVYTITEPLLAPIRRMLAGVVRAPVDFSPLVLLLLSQLLIRGIARSTVFF